MISKIINQVIDPWMCENEFIEHYGGFTLPKSIKGIDQEGNRFENIFPFSCDTAVDECTKDNQWLVPHKNKVSVAYWEQLGDAEVVQDSPLAPGFSAAHFQQDMRFVYWFNFGKMGYESPTEIKSYLQLEFFNSLDQAIVRNTDEGIKKL